MVYDNLLKGLADQGEALLLDGLDTKITALDLKTPQQKAALICIMKEYRQRIMALYIIFIITLVFGLIALLGWSLTLITLIRL